MPVERGAQDRDVGGAGTDRGGGPAWMAEQQVYLGHQRVQGVALDDPLEQVCAGAGLDRDGEPDGLGAGPAGTLHRSAGRLDRDPAVLEQDGAGRGQGDPAAGAIEQPDAELALELADSRREGWLGQAQAGRRPGEVELFGDGDEVAEFAQLDLIHTRSVWNDGNVLGTVRS